MIIVDKMGFNHTGGTLPSEKVVARGGHIIRLGNRIHMLPQFPHRFPQFQPACISFRPQLLDRGIVPKVNVGDEIRGGLE